MTASEEQAKNLTIKQLRLMCYDCGEWKAVTAQADTGGSSSIPCPDCGRVIGTLRVSGGF